MHSTTRKLILASFASCLFSLLQLPADSAFAFQKEELAEGSKWILQSRDSNADLPSAISSRKPLSKKEAEKYRKELWKALQNVAKKSEAGKVLPKPISTKENRLAPKLIKTGGKEMPFLWLNRNAKGKKRPMFIALHGGGRMNTKTPHGGAVNTREWRTQIQFAKSLYPDGHMYFVPRMADDRDGRWYYSYCQDAYRAAVEDAVLRHNVDPNRIYLIGISEGAYTAYRLGAFMADRWAGAGSMAGGEPTQNAPPVNMRNLAFRADIGERDTMFDRVGLNVRFGKALDALQKDDSEGYKHVINVQKGRGHGINYRPCPNWLIKNKRNPWPKRIRWENINVHGRRKDVFYWIGIPKDALNSFHQSNKNSRILIDAKVNKKSNSVEVSVSIKNKKEADKNQTLPLYVYLNDDLLDLDKPITIVRNGKKVFSGKVERTAENLVRSMGQRRDPYYSFPVRVEL